MVFWLNFRQTCNGIIDSCCLVFEMNSNEISHNIVFIKSYTARSKTPLESFFVNFTLNTH